MKALTKIIAVTASITAMPAMAHISPVTAVQHGVEHAGLALGVAVVIGVLVAVAAIRR